MKKESNIKCESSKWIIFGGIELRAYAFDCLFEYAYKQGGSRRPPRPLLVQGPRGAGKSLFLEIFRYHFLADRPGKTIEVVNAAALPENLIESELFGHVKGAFTGADKEKMGLLEVADLLILDEIGELAPRAQAKLLTFLETGKFRRVGDTTERKTKDGFLLVGTTNKKKGDPDLRPDFYDRFMVFQVPGLHERRVDTLRQLYWAFPDVIRELKPWEILSLLSHPWPGNCREVEQFGEDVAFWNFRSERMGPPDDTPDEGETAWKTGFDFEPAKAFFGKLKVAGIDLRAFESMLNGWGLGVNPENMKKPFRRLSDPQYGCYEREYGGIKTTDEGAPCHMWGDGVLVEVFTGPSWLLDWNFKRFCWMFDINPYSEENLLEAIGSGFPPGHFFDESEFTPKEKRLSDQIRGFVVDHKKAMGSVSAREPDIYLSWAEVERKYFTDLVTATRGNIAEAARRAGLKDSTLRKRLKTLKIVENSQV